MAGLWFQERKDGVNFKVFVQPRAARNQIVGVHDAALKISLTAPPVEGAANRLCRDFMAKSLKLSRGRVEVVGGLKSRRKTVHVKDLSGVELLALLQEYTA
ncbi:MAG: YggU family protein [Deltaproteobacteria bacterium]|nr:YggU family protein [Deltaproteobacteria bacterium]